MSGNKQVISAYTMLIIFVVMALSGAILLFRLPVSFNPATGSNGASITFSCPGMSARQIESEVTAVLEAAVIGMEGVEDINSNSVKGYGSLQLEFDEHAPMYQVRAELSQIVRRIYPFLPKNCSYPLVKVQSENASHEKDLLVVAVCGNQPVAEICNWLKLTVVPELSKIKGISRVSISPELNYAWKLYYNPLQLQHIGITPGQIATQLAQLRYAADLGNSTVAGQGISTSITLATPQIRGDSVASMMLNGKTYAVANLFTPILATNDKLPSTKINGANTVELQITVGASENVIKIAPLALATLYNLIPTGEFRVFPTFNAATVMRSELNLISLRTLVSLAGLFVFMLLINRNSVYIWLTFLSLLVNILISFTCCFILNIGIDTWMLAGITISMGLTIDGCIVVTDHVMRFRNKKIFTALVVAHLTTICTLVIMFFLDKSLQLSMQGFIWAVLINLVVSLPVAYYFVPALLQYLPVKRKEKATPFRRRRSLLGQLSWLRLVLGSILRRRKLVVFLIVLLFGIPVFLLPHHVNNKFALGHTINRYLNSDGAKRIRKWTENISGGTFRLFMQQNVAGSKDVEKKTALRVSMSVATGAKRQYIATVAEQLDSLVNTVSGIDTCVTVIGNAEYASMHITFKREHENGNLPVYVKEQLEDWARNCGLLDFEISGVGMPFNNSQREENTNYSLAITGYNLDKVIAAGDEVKRILKSNSRVRQIYTSTNSTVSNQRSAEFSYVFRLKSADGLLVRQFNFNRAGAEINAVAPNEVPVACSWDDSNLPVYLSPVELPVQSEWQMLQYPMQLDSGAIFKLRDIATIEKDGNSIGITRKGQEYCLFVNYNFFGESDAGRFLEETILTHMQEKLPVGFNVTDARDYATIKPTLPMYQVLLIAVVLIFILCSVLLNSLLEAWAVIWMIPISFIGLFAAAIWLDIRPGSGAFAAMVFLAGLVVNWALYILNDYNQLRRQQDVLPHLNTYLRAFRRKIIPIVLSAISASISVIPFVLTGIRDEFWFAFGICTLGGIAASVLGTVFLLPLFLRLQNSRN